MINQNYLKSKRAFFEKTTFWVILFFALNFLLRGVLLTKNPLSGDEPFSLYHAQMTISEIIAELTKGNNPPLFEIILHYWIGFKDISLEWIRLLTLIFSALTASFFFLLAKEIKNQSFAILATLIYTFSTYHLQYAQEIRVYSLFGLLTVISFWVFIKLWKNNLTWKWWIYFTITNIAIIYAHYFGFFVLFIQTICYLYIHYKDKVSLRKYGIYTGVMLVLYLPLLSIVLSRFSANSGNKGWLESPTSLEALYDMLWRFSNKPIVTVLGIIILFSAIVKWVLAKNKQLSNEAKLLLIWFSISFFGMFLLSFKIPMFLDRYLIYGSFSYILLLVYCLYYLFPAQKWSALFSSVIVLLFAATFQLYKPTKRDAPKIVEAVSKAQDDAYKVIICPPDFMPTFGYYYNQKWFQQTDVNSLYNRLINNLKQRNIFFVYSYDDLKTNSSKWLYVDVASSLIVPNNHILERLSQSHKLVREEMLDEITKVYYFEQ